MACWCILNFVFCLTLLLPLGGGHTPSDTKLDDLLDNLMNASGEKDTKSIIPACDPLIRFTDGSKTTISISGYLNSSRVLPCSKNISMRLKKIFQGNAQTRSDLVDIVGDLCSAYVNLTSVIFFKNLSQAICNEQSLSNQTLEQSFCSRIHMKEDAEIPVIKTELESFKQIHHHFTDLISLGANCEEKCGGKNSGVLCNAYYSMALLLSKNANIKTMKGMLCYTKLISGPLPTSNFSMTSAI